jgi:C4-dicarboxylate transporter, DctM subunit
MLAFAIIATLILLILVGVPIAVALGVTAVGTYVALGESFVLTMLGQRMYASATGFTLLAIPFFILAGNLMNTGGITTRIFHFSQTLVGHISGGLAQVNVVASLIFSGMSGAAVADAAGLGQVEIKSMRDAGFDDRFAAAVTAASSTIGPVFPPSVPLVIYGGLTGVSVVKLFIAGIVPGLIMATGLMLTVYFVSRRRGYPVERRAKAVELWQAFRGAILPVMTPVIIIGGILGGVFTPTEAGVVACLYALFLAMVVYREITWRDLPRILWESVAYSIRVLFIIAAAGFFSWLLIHKRVPDSMITGLLTVSTEPAVLLGLIIVILLVLGMFLEGIAVIVITVPLFMPVVAQIGVDPLQFGLVMVMCSMLGLLTPPVGMILFAVSSISGVRVGALVAELWPYLLAILAVTLLIAYVPALSTWLPGVLAG